MARVMVQFSFGSKKLVHANGTAERGADGNLKPRKLTQAECEAIVAERQAANDGYSYTIEP